MQLMKLNYNLFFKILDCFGINELKILLYIDYNLSRFVTQYVSERCRLLHVHNFTHQKHAFIQEFKNLRKLSLYINETKQKLIQECLQSIPNTIIKLKLQIDAQYGATCEFFSKLSKYQSQLKSLKLVLVGPYAKDGVGRDASPAFIHNSFYKKMAKLNKLKVQVGQVDSKDCQLQNHLFYALFYFDPENDFVPNIKSIQFDNIHDVSQLTKPFVKPENFRKNTVVTSVCLKSLSECTIQSYLDPLLNYMEKPLYLIQLFGQQVTKLSITQHINYVLKLKEGLLAQLFDYFECLTSLRLNGQAAQQSSYDQEYEFENFELDSLRKYSLKKLGLASLTAPWSHLNALLSELDLKALNLDFTNLNDDCVDAISNFRCLSELHIRGCKHITSEGLIKIFQKQKGLKSLDVRGLHYFNKKSFRALTSNCLLKKLCISQNKLNNAVFVELLDKNKLSLESLNFGDFSKCNDLTEDCFRWAIQRQIKMMNLKTLSIHLHAESLPPSALKYIIQITPNLRVLNLKFRITESNLREIFTSLLEEKSLRFLEKLILSGVGTREPNLNQDFVQLAQALRDKFKLLHTISINSARKCIFEAFKATKGKSVSNLRVMLLQHQEQYYI